MAVRASGMRYASDWREEEDLPAPGGLGRPDGLPGERQVSAGRFSVLFFVSVLYFCYYVLIQIKDQTIFKIHENNCLTQMDLIKATQQFPELLNIYLLYNKYRSNSNIYWINSNGQNKCF